MFVKVTGINHWTDEEEEIFVGSFQGLVFEHRDAFSPLRLYDAATRKPILIYEGRVWRRTGDDEDSQHVYAQIFINPVSEDAVATSSTTTEGSNA